MWGAQELLVHPYRGMAHHRIHKTRNISALKHLDHEVGIDGITEVCNPLLPTLAGDRPHSVRQGTYCCTRYDVFSLQIFGQIGKSKA